MQAIRVSMLAALSAVMGSTTSFAEPPKPVHRLVPFQPMSQDVEILHGDPDAAGQPFVMRIRELPGGIIPPHKHPVDEHITVVQGTLYFGVGDKFAERRCKS